MGIVTWVDKRGMAHLLGAALYLSTFLGPSIEALIGVIRDKRAAWLWHPFISLLTVITYSYQFGNRSLSSNGI